MFLDATYFEGELYLPYFKRKPGEAVGSAAVVLQTVAEYTLEWFVEKYEQECLERILGREMYKRFVKGLEDEEDKGYGDWLVLRDRLFMKRGRYGFSPVANYVYFFLMRSGRSQTSGVGEVVGRMDHALGVDNVCKLVKVWNDMCRMVASVYDFLVVHGDVYGELEGVDMGCFKGISSFGI